MANTPDKSKLSVCSIGTGEKSEKLFASLTEEQTPDDEEETLNNDEVAYSLVYLKPTEELKDGAKLIVDTERFISERDCY